MAEAKEPTQLESSEMSPADIQKAIDEQAKAMTTKKKPQKATVTDDKPVAVKVTKTEKAAPAKKSAVKTVKTEKAAPAKKPAAKKESESIPIKVKITKTSGTVPDKKEEEAPKIRVHTKKMIRPLSEEKRSAKEAEPGVEEEAPEEQAVEAESETAEGTSDPEEASIEEVAVAEQEPETEEAVSEDDKSDAPQVADPEDAETEEKDEASPKKSGDYASTNIKNLSRQMGDDKAKTPLQEAEDAAKEQHGLKTFDTNQYHLPIKANHHHTGAKDTFYYFVIFVVIFFAALFVASQLELIDIPVLSDI